MSKCESGKTLGISVRNKAKMANSVDPDETAHYKPSHAFSSGSTLFTKVSFFICKVEGVKMKQTNEKSM